MAGRDHRVRQQQPNARRRRASSRDQAITARAARAPSSSSRARGTRGRPSGFISEERDRRGNRPNDYNRNIIVSAYDPLTAEAAPFSPCQIARAYITYALCGVCVGAQAADIDRSHRRSINSSLNGWLSVGICSVDDA